MLTLSIGAIVLYESVCYSTLMVPSLSVFLL